MESTAVEFKSYGTSEAVDDSKWIEEVFSTPSLPTLPLKDSPKMRKVREQLKYEKFTYFIM